MKLLTGIRPTHLIALVGLAVAAGLGYAYYTTVQAVPASFVPSSVDAQAALGPGESVLIKDSTSGPPSGTLGSGRTLGITAAFDAAGGGSVSWAWRAEACHPSPVAREHVLSSVLGSQALVQSWVVCLPSTAGEPVTTSKVWYPADAKSTARPEGVVLVVPLESSGKGGEHLFATAGGLCPDEDSPCVANLQIGVSRHPSRLSMALPGEKDSTLYFVLERASLKRAWRSVAQDYDEVSVGEATAEGEVLAAEGEDLEYASE